jgi:hypothetical protein
MGIFGRLLAIVPQIPLSLGVDLAGFAVSNLAFLGSVYYLYKLSERVVGNAKLAFDSAIFLALYPAGIFLSATYSESLFLILTLSSLYYWDSGAKSGLLGFLATLTRPVGIFLAIPYLYRALVDSSKRGILGTYLPVIGPLLGYLSFMAFSQFVTGTPFANFAAERMFWGVTSNPQTILKLAYNDIHDHPIIIPYLVLSVGGTLASIWKAAGRAERAIDLYAIGLLVAYLPTPIISFPRYSITLVPEYWSFSRWSQRLVVRVFLYALFLVLLAIGTGLYVNWYSFY